MQTEIRYHPKAQEEALKSAPYYERQQAGLGAEFFVELDLAVCKLLSDPQRAKADLAGVRSWRLQRFPFRVYYVIDPYQIRILAVAHLKRIPSYWSGRSEE